MYETTVHSYDDPGSLGRAIDALTEGQRGAVATRLAIGMGLADDPVGLERAYAANRAALNLWWGHISPSRLAALAGTDLADVAEIQLSQHPMLVFGAGLVAGTALALIIRK